MSDAAIYETWANRKARRSVRRNLRVEGLEARQCLNAARVAADDRFTVAAGHTLEVPSSNTPAGTLLAAGSIWRYLDDGSNQGTAWRNAGFNEQAWASGAVEFGYGDGDEATVLSPGANVAVKPITTYFRRTLTVADPAALTNLRLRLNYDDGAVVYVNGQEVLRASLPVGPVSHNTLATTANEGRWTEFDISSAPFIAGENVLAVEIHQVNVSSSDISFDLELLGGEAGPAPVAGVLLNDSDANGDRLCG